MRETWIGFRRGGVLTLDCARTVGWAYGHPSEPQPKTGFFRLTPPTEGGRFNTFDTELHYIFDLLAPRKLTMASIIPLPALNNRLAALQQIGLRAIALGWAYGSGCGVIEVSEDLVRYEMLGRSRFKKGETKLHVMAYARENGWEGDNHDAADAWLMWMWLREKLVSGQAVPELAELDP
jgi:hypothetical protein